MPSMRLLTSIVFGAIAFQAGAAESPPLGEPGQSARYRIATPVDAASVVEAVDVSLGAADAWNGRKGQWLRLDAVKFNGESFSVAMLLSEFPPESLAQGHATVLRYIVKEGDARPVEYRHGVTGFGVLPLSGAWPHLLPRGEDGVLPESVTMLGHRYGRETLQHGAPAAYFDDARIVELRPDVLTGVPHNTRQVDETRRYDDSEYEYIPLTQHDFETMIAAGLNCFKAEPDTLAWFQEAGVFYYGVGGAQVPYPECLYRPQYLGATLFLDEPAVVTRDHDIRPRLREDPEFRKSITVDDALHLFEEHFADVVTRGAPTQLLAGLGAREDVDLGSMQFLQRSVYSWETMIASSAHQLLFHPEAPGAIVFEPPGQLGTRRTLPAMNMSYGCQIPVAGDHFIDIIIGFLRGAARASGKEWGISIYGGVDRAEAPAFFARAYELGATRFFFWDNARLACVPFGEVLDLSRRLNAQSTEYPHRELEGLRNAAETVILLPPGYNLGHVFMGKGILWGVGELNLDRLNSEGVPYRTVMHHFFTEIERCLRLGVAFDLLWDLPGISIDGYREVVRIREDGKVEVIEDGNERVLDGPRVPARPDGDAPRLEVTIDSPEPSAPCVIHAAAHVVEGSAPVYYAPAPDAHGVHHNQRVAWELYGPGEEDYAHRAPEIVVESVTPHPEAGHIAQAAFHIERPGRYRLRAATTDLAGRSTVVVREITIR